MNDKTITAICIISIAIIGCWLISDVQTITGVILLIWANNFSYKRSEINDYEVYKQGEKQ